MRPNFPEKYRIPNPVIDAFLVDGVFATVSGDEGDYRITVSDKNDRSKIVSELRLKKVIKKLFGNSYLFYKADTGNIKVLAQHYNVRRLEA